MTVVGVENVDAVDLTVSGGHPSAVRTAVVVVHGMGEQLPSETLYRFVKTAAPAINGERHYYSRPAKVTDSFEARRCLVDRRTVGDVTFGQTEFFEYHWSYMMTGNKITDLFATLRRLMLRSPSTVPYGLKRVWWIVWGLIVAVVAGVAWLLWSRGGVQIKEFTLGGLAAALGASAVLVGLIKLIVKGAESALTKSFVDVVRYLDRSPRSYAVRHDIRKGMIDLLQSIHDTGRYSRLVVVAHSLGGYIAYDAIAYLWPTMCHQHAGGSVADDRAKALITELQSTARELVALEDELVQPDLNGKFEKLSGRTKQTLDRYRAQQFNLWKQMRRQGNPWLITDLVTVGTPMYFADLLYTKNRAEFEQFVRNAEIPVCPPQAGSQTVEGKAARITRYGFFNKGRTVLSHGAPFAVVRWTNLFFPAENGWRGDWFGGPLRPLFGKGILDEPILGNGNRRSTPGLAHSRYFDFPDELGVDDAATVIQSYLALNIDDELNPLLAAPKPDPATGVFR